uniref:C6 domain-containing protein n=1 Tax=Steinernema glaseri TaxID=37863 RepID=A0A1I7Z9L7_9BILA
MSPLVLILLSAALLQPALTCIASKNDRGAEVSANPKVEPPKDQPPVNIGCMTCGDAIELTAPGEEGVRTIRVDETGVHESGCMTRKIGCDGVEGARATRLVWNYGTLVQREEARDPKYVEATLHCNDQGEWVLREEEAETMIYEVSCYSSDSNADVGDFLPDSIANVVVISSYVLLMSSYALHIDFASALRFIEDVGGWIELSGLILSPDRFL